MNPKLLKESGKPAPQVNRPNSLLGIVEIDEFLLKPSFQKWLLNVVLSLIVAFLLVGKLEKGKSLRSYKVGDIALEDIYAPDDIMLTDQEATEERRLLAERSVYPVFDYRPELSAAVESQVRKIFNGFRYLYQPEWDWNEAERNRVDIARKELGRRVAPIPWVPIPGFAEKEKSVKNELSALLLVNDNKRAETSERIFNILKQERFSENIEEKIIALVKNAMDDGIVSDKSVITGKKHVITVRVLKMDGSFQDEYPRGDIKSLKSLDEAKEFINVYAREQWSRELSRSTRNVIVEFAQNLLRPNYIFNKEVTQQKYETALANIEPVMVQIKKGQKIVGQGEVVTEEVAKNLKLLERREGGGAYFPTFVGNFLWVMVFLAVLYSFPAVTVKKFKPTMKDLINLSLLLLILLIFLRIVNTSFADLLRNRSINVAYLVPMLSGGMLIRLLINSETALVFSVATALFSAVMTREPILGVYVLVGSLLGANEMENARTRTLVAKAGVMTGMANVFVTLAFAVKSGRFFEIASVYNMLLAFGGGVLAIFVVLGIMPIAEALFGYVTDIRLLELANQEHPLLKALVVNAPGTYQHSVMLGTLVEAAAEAIHVNPLLAKVMALYHDIGKMEKPSYFSENQRKGENVHDNLQPSMSAIILVSHVKYGIELAKMYKLPQVIIDAIPQHHGTRLIKYFYAKAREKENPELQQVLEDEYRYPGPKPQTREAGILMLADTVEATAKSMEDPSPQKLKVMVKRTISEIFGDGQLDECELTLKDLNAIAEAFTKVLSSIYHSRPQYPQIPTAKKFGELNGGKKDAGYSAGDEQSFTEQEREIKNKETTRKNSIRSPV